MRLDYRHEIIKIDDIIKKIKKGIWKFETNDFEESNFFRYGCIRDIFENVPIENVFIVVSDYGYNIVQFKNSEKIIGSIYEYCCNRFKMNGKYYKELEDLERSNFENYKINIYVIQNSIWQKFLQNINQNYL
jgi:hypothetical protein